MENCSRIRNQEIIIHRNFESQNSRGLLGLFLLTSYSGCPIPSLADTSFFLESFATYPWPFLEKNSDGFAVFREEKA